MRQANHELITRCFSDACFLYFNLQCFFQTDSYLKSKITKNENRHKQNKQIFEN
eukprot:UN33970